MTPLSDKLFRLMAERRASDIFVTAGAPIQIKIEGVVHPVNAQNADAELIARLVGEILDEAGQRRFAAEKEMNLSVGRSGFGNFRVNLFRQRGSTSLVIRHIPEDIPPLSSLNLPQVLADVVMEKRGLVLVVGATGSGKSTTLASMIDHRSAHRSGHILTVEDPIEYHFHHRKSVVDQREIGIDTASWEIALKNAMRQAPDCILIGEIRDSQTMGAALSYAQTGHLCLSTLHASNSYHALNRIINFYPMENRSALLADLAVSLKCIVSQRLVTRSDGKRTPAVEVLLNTRHIAELIERGETSAIKEAMEQSLATGSQTFEQDLFRLYREKFISLDEALAHADSPTNLYWLINNAGLPAPETEPRTGGNDARTGEISFSEFVLNDNGEGGRH